MGKHTVLQKKKNSTAVNKNYFYIILPHIKVLYCVTMKIKQCRDAHIISAYGVPIPQSIKVWAYSVFCRLYSTKTG